MGPCLLGSYGKQAFHGQFFSNRTTIFERCVVRCECKNEHQKHVFKRDWTSTCPKYVTHYILAE